MNEMYVNAWEEIVVIPTYPVGEPNKNPMFFEKRIYQGSSGAVYPNPVIEQIGDHKQDKEYIGLFLENKYLKIMILPELGGRVQMAYDKIRERHFIYYNQVIKPALVGLCGPWISGGIEFNWPQHHRPSTFERVDYTIEEGEGGSKIIWINEIERMSHTKGMAGFVLYPDKAYLEIKAKLYNRTNLPQTFLWWANPAVKVNDDYQSIFPPDVFAVFDHGKRDVSAFPIAKGVYYKVDYAPGTDISRYKNIPVPTSYMAVQSEFDFMGAYEHDTKAGMLHVADHHISPGKKQWTWGDGEFGHSWDRNLTDEDGPYIELMTGIFTENQPDFAWLQPNEEKNFEQYFMPYASVGAVKNATKEAMLNLELEGRNLAISVYTTAVYNLARIVVTAAGKEIENSCFDLSPEHVFEKEINLVSAVALVDLEMIVQDSNGNILVSYKPEIYAAKEMPPAATAAVKPAQIECVEELYLNGLHLEQYRHATFNPMDYYEEALRRAPEDIRTNNAVGLFLLKRGQFLKAEAFFNVAAKSLILRNNNPYTGEVFYNLGYCLQLQGRYEEAYDQFYKSIWNDAFQHNGFLALARIAAVRKPLDAFQLIEKSLVRNYHSPAARHLKTILLRTMGRITEAENFIEESLKIDPFNYGCLFEQYLVFNRPETQDKALKTLKHLVTLMHDAVHNYLEYALDYAQAGFYKEAIQLLHLYLSDKKNAYPMVYYYLGWLYLKIDDLSLANTSFTMASMQVADYCFPNKIEDVVILKAAIHQHAKDAKAWYYLGNFWYAHQQYTEAIDCWRNSAELDDGFATVQRNLSLACYNKLNAKDEALMRLEKAFYADQGDSRVLMELDQLYKQFNKSAQFRLDFLNKYPLLVAHRDDLYLERVTLYNNLGHYAKAKELLSVRQFHPWEGGEGKVGAQYLLCHLELAKQMILERNYDAASGLLNDTDNYPDHLGEGKLFQVPENDINYLKGCIELGLGFTAEARLSFEKAASGTLEPVQAIFYNDPQPDQLFYQGLAWARLGYPEKANEIFRQLISFGNDHLNDVIEIDYFAVSLPDLALFDQDLNLKNKLHCHYLIGLGQVGLNNIGQAKFHFNEVLINNINHQGVLVHQKMIIFLAQLSGL
jgi:tetratricopeptide (TPR) repeat protein